MTRPAGLKDHQITLEPGILYEVWAQDFRGERVQNWSQAQLAASIEINGAACDVYGSQFIPENAPADMPVIFSAAEGIKVFDFIPSYLWVSGSPTSIVLNGVGALNISPLIAQNRIAFHSKANLVIDE